MHAGAAPTSVLKTLDALEDVGAAADSLVLGPAALLAYRQASGLQPPVPAADARDASVWVLLQQKLTAKAKAKRKLHSSKAFQVNEFKVRDSCFLKFSQYANTHLKQAGSAKPAKEQAAGGLENAMGRFWPRSGNRLRSSRLSSARRERWA